MQNQPTNPTVSFPLLLQRMKIHIQSNRLEYLRLGLGYSFNQTPSGLFFLL